ncbi:hypothetical protein SAMN05428988_4111 [Chitinophaga sp. YR573]|uniref:DUF2321 domain-containing protein n=1 Tax=Chitinophaga sp. YR573 TaxID=1881040 RepID=UPI0008CEF2F1|nr:DUF2321 domain-containing protein [Chitinophaga sp. YR573]SEW34334.1 hypothetical protein SAMN05428988_4111 [Chitinophaga sp. YR573]
MAKQDTQEVCLNGHQITDRYYSSPEFRKKFCTTCGEKTIHTCPSCAKDIKGHMIYENVIDLSGRSTPVPNICDNCGADFPWREKKQKIKELSNPTNVEKDATFLIGVLCDRFHLIVKQLRQRHNDRPTLDINDEYDVQDLLHSLLKIYFDDIRPEEWNPSYAGSSTRSDFLLKDEQIIIEVKKTRTGLKAKQLGEQLIIDIAHYKNNFGCKILYCFVYDPEGYISNPKGIESDLSKNETGFNVIVNIIPKGH